MVEKLLSAIWWCVKKLFLGIWWCIKGLFLCILWCFKSEPKTEETVESNDANDYEQETYEKCKVCGKPIDDAISTISPNRLRCEKCKRSYKVCHNCYDNPESHKCPKCGGKLYQYVAIKDLII